MSRHRIIAKSLLLPFAAAVLLAATVPSVQQSEDCLCTSEWIWINGWAARCNGNCPSGSCGPTATPCPEPYDDCAVCTCDGSVCDGLCHAGIRKIQGITQPPECVSFCENGAECREGEPDKDDTWDNCECN